MKDNRRQEIFEKMAVPKSTAVMALPTMLSMLVMIIYNMADTFFRRPNGGRISDGRSVADNADISAL